MKKIIALLLASVLALSAFSCGTEVITCTIDKDDPGLKTSKLSGMVLPISPKLFNDGTSKPGSEYDDFYKMAAEQRDEYGKISDAMNGFYEGTVPGILHPASDKNMVYSPVNVYMALSLLAECTQGKTREEILSLLKVKNTNELKNIASSLWHANFCDNGITTINMGNSVWLQNGLPVVDDCIRMLAEKYYADTYQGEMGSEELDNELRNWLNEHTGNLLKDNVDGVKTDKDTIIALASALYFKGGWEDEFNSEANIQKTFHAYGKDEENVTFMTETHDGEIFEYTNFTGFLKTMGDGNLMLFALPKDGVTTEDLVKDEEYLRFMSSTYEDRQANARRAEVHFEVPKFDVSSDVDLIDSLRNLGINVVFKPGKTDGADFTGILQNNDLEPYVDTIEHAARVKIDEEGCEAAAFTLISVKATGMIIDTEKVDFILDRPFLFSIQGYSGAVLFTGVVNTAK